MLSTIELWEMALYKWIIVIIIIIISKWLDLIASSRIRTLIVGSSYYTSDNSLWPVRKSTHQCVRKLNKQ